MANPTSNSIFDTELQDVDDPSDWTDKDMQQLDHSLRCQVCGELMKAAISSVKCFHSFCSLCIRHHLDQIGECPTCRTKVIGLDFKPNYHLQEIIQAFQNARSKLLDLVRTAEASAKTSEQRNEVTVDGRSDIKEKEKSQQPLKRKRSASIDVEKGDASRRYSTRSTRKSVPVVEISDDDFQRSDGGESTEDESLETEPADLDSGPCPVCQETVKLERINSHLNYCLNGQKDPLMISNTKYTKKTLPSSSTKPKAPSKPSQPVASHRPMSSKTPSASGTQSTKGKNPDVTTKVAQKKSNPVSGLSRLAKVQYGLLKKEKEIRNLLEQHKLPTHGSREQMIRRHKEYVARFNANLDALEPKPLDELRKEIRIWESALNTVAFTQEKGKSKMIAKKWNEDDSKANNKRVNTGQPSSTASETQHNSEGADSAKGDNEIDVDIYGLEDAIGNDTEFEIATAFPSEPTRESKTGLQEVGEEILVEFEEEVTEVNDINLYSGDIIVDSGSPKPNVTSINLFSQQRITTSTPQQPYSTSSRKSNVVEQMMVNESKTVIAGAPLNQNFNPAGPQTSPFVYPLPVNTAAIEMPAAIPVTVNPFSLASRKSKSISSQGNDTQSNSSYVSDDNTNPSTRHTNSLLHDPTWPSSIDFEVSDFQPDD
ncbi:hypothetical protein BKA69DRAFT_1124067 [Paraphysoderma sedebokerense]|nr:hypothetical protein BKA69DRAFT_1124067 [Paraphysoderma sedebokerense]